MTYSIFQIIANPNAKRGQSRQTLARILSYLKENQIDTVIHTTSYPRHGIQLVQELIEQGHTCFLSAGGDGTAFEVINGIMSSGKNLEITLGILPLGTGNAFLTDFSITTAKEAAKRILPGKTQPIDIGQIQMEDETVYFHNMMGFCFIAEACRVQRDCYRRFGRFSYHAAFLHCLFNVRNQHVTLEVDGSEPSTAETSMFAICNSKYTGYAMKISPESSVQDGRFNFILAPNLTAWQILSLFQGLPQGKHLQDKRIHHQLIEKINIKFPHKQDVMVDGEILSFQDAEISVLSGALNLLI